MKSRKLQSLLTMSLLLSLLTACSSDKGSVSSDLSASPEQTAVETENTEENVPEESTDELATGTYDFADSCEEYLTYIGENFHNRDILEVNADIPKDSTHDATRDWIVSELKKAGFSDDQITLQEFTREGDDDVKYAGCNVLLKIPGKSSDHSIVAGAHYDGDGCGDNGSGIALLLGNAVNYVNVTPAYDITIAFFDGEETGELGAYSYLESLSKEETSKISYMINIDSIAFGDYCNIYGGIQDNEKQTIFATDAYDLAVEKAHALGMNVYTTEDLDGYYAKEGHGPKIEPSTLYTNPWTFKNPAPKNAEVMSPSTGYWGDHVPFEEMEIPYLYLEATNWYAEGNLDYCAFTGYFETDDPSLGDGGMFMNTPYDTLENLTKIFPGRSLEHFHIYSPLLSAMLLDASI